MIKTLYIVQQLNPSGTWRDVAKSDQEITARLALKANRQYNEIVEQNEEFRLIKRSISEEVLDASEVDEDTTKLR